MVRSGRLFFALILFLSAALVTGMLGCGGGKPADRIVITADRTQISAGQTAQLQAVAIDFQNASRDVSGQVTWASSNVSVATVSSKGVLTGLVAGTADITATVQGLTGHFICTVGSPLVSGLTLSPAVPNVYVGGKQKFTATATYVNNTTGDVSQSVQWAVTPLSVAVIDQTGLLTALAPGSFTLTATLGAQTTTLTGTVTTAPVMSLALTPAVPVLTGGSSLQLIATATFADGSTRDISSMVNWVSSAPAVLTVDANGKITAKTVTAPTTVTIQAQLGTTSASVSVQVNPGATLQQLYVVPTSSSVANGTAERHTALAVYSDGSQKDVSQQVTWSVAQPSASVVRRSFARLATASSAVSAQDAAGASSVVTVDATGQSWAMAPGTALLQASLETIQAKSVVIVTPATVVSLKASSTEPLLQAGVTQPLQLTGVFSDGTSQDLTLSAKWQSADPSIATVDPSTGIATGVASGKVNFTGTFAGQTATIQLTVLPAKLVSTVISVPDAASPVGFRQQLSLSGTYSDGTTHDITSLATWTSADATVLPVSSSGVAQALHSGVTQVIATVGNQSAITTLVVVPATLKSLAILPQAPRFALGTTLPFTAIASFTDGISVDVSADAIWTSSDPTVLTINGSGVAKSGKVGTTTVTATFLGLSQVSAVVEVTDAKLVRLIVKPGTAQIAAMTGAHYTATGFFSDGTLQDVTSDVKWTSADMSVAVLDTTGRALGIAQGDTQVVASLLGSQASSSLTVTNATLLSVALIPGNSKVPLTTLHQYSMQGMFSDGTTQILSHGLVWTSPTPTICPVHEQGQVVGLGVGVGAVTAQRGYFSATTPVTVTDATLKSIALTPSTNTLHQYQGQQLSSVGTFSDGFQEDLYLNAVYTSADTSVVVPVDATGMVFAAGLGKSQITSTVGNISSTSSFTVLDATLASLVITPSNPVLVSGTQQQFTATGTYMDGTSAPFPYAQWSSSNPAAISVDANGLATVHPVSAETSVILTGQAGNKTTTTSIKAEPAGYTASPYTSIVITPSTPQVAAGSTTKLTATATTQAGTTVDVSNMATWTTGNAAVATVDGTGRVSGIGNGTTSVRANIGSVAGSVQVSVGSGSTPPSTGVPTLTGISIVPSSSLAAAGTTVQLKVNGTYSDGSTQVLTSGVTWSSQNLRAATVDQTGLVKAVAKGMAGVQATLGGMVATSAINVSDADLVSLAISPNGASFAAGTTKQFTLTGTFSDGTTQNLNSSAVWSSSAPAVATISRSGVASGVAPGAVSFSATYGDSVVSTPVVTVTPATLVSVSVTPSAPSFAAGSTQQFTVIGTYSDGTTQDLTSSAAFTSSNPNVLSVNPAGLATGLTAGTAQLTITVQGRTITTPSVTVTPATLISIAVTSASSVLPKGTTQQFTATGRYSDGSTQDLSNQILWNSSDPSVLTIDGSGRAQAAGLGSAQVSATSNGITSASGTLQVTPATLVSVALSPLSAQIAKGTRQQFTVTGTYTDGTTVDLSSQATWTSTDSSVVSIDANGLAAGTGIGTAQVTAAIGGKSATTSNFSVSAATLVSVAFQPTQISLAKGTGTSVTVIGTFTDGSTQDLTAMAIFTSSNTTVAQIDQSGAVTGLAPGTSTISMQVNGVSNSLNVTVTPEVLISLAITPSNASFAKGTRQQFHAIGTFSDGSTQDLSSFVAWSTSDTSVFTIDNQGLAMGTGLGSAALTASYQGQSVTAPPVSVTAATVASLTVAPAAPTAVVGATQQFTATLTFTDSSTQDVTATASWTSSNTAVATISATGLASAVAQGSTSILAAASGVSGIDTLVVTTASTNPSNPASLVSVAITPSTASVAAGGSQQFNVFGTYSDGSTQNLSAGATWVSSNPAVATVSSTGLASAIAQGDVTIQVTAGGIGASATLTVTAASTNPPPTSPTLQSLTISPIAASLGAGSTLQFTATGLYSDGSTQNVTNQTIWQSSVPTVATISSNGLLSARAGGNTQVWASFDGQTAMTTAVVNPATLIGLTVTPTVASIATGTAQQFTALATFSDGSSRDLTSSVTWTSSD
ncbi:MAG: Ig-like domain-containing protein, partial [Janthinobacterium lividum]